MVQPSTASHPGDAPGGASANSDWRLRAPFAILLVALLWAAQLVNAASVITATAQAQIAQYFHTTQIAWYSLIYVLCGTLLLPFVVKLGDMFGKKRIMIVVIVIGLIGDVISALAPTYAVLLIGRAISACYVPVAPLVFATARDIFPARRVGTATGIIGATLGAIIAVGPLIAGFLLDNVGFRGAIWFVSACTAVALLLVIVLVPETPRRAAGAFDWLGGVLLGASIIALMYGVSQGSVWGWLDARVLALAGGAVVILLGFVLVERRVAHPLLDLPMLSRREVATVLSAGSIVQGTAFVAAAIMTVVIPLYPRIPGVSDGLGWSAMQGALVGLPAGVVLFVVGMAAGASTRRFDPRVPWLLGVVITMAGLVAAGFYHHNAVQIIATGMLTALGAGMVYACNPILILSAVTPREQALASGMSLMLLGVVITFVTQVLFTVLGSHSTVVKGTALYLDAGYRNGYFVLAGCVLIGLVVSLLIPKLRRPADIEAGTAAAG
ncbi:MFS transporter [Actinopolymorpha sp. B17G11]|uniref:MFS transporter n=1 Tax=Actinopolymorpha sp. B17G11 TaxID=3160861 RepID=UPI0032E495F3